MQRLVREIYNSIQAQLYQLAETVFRFAGKAGGVTSQKSNVSGPSATKTLDTAPYPELMASLNQLAANRANAQLSSGPTSSEGKAKVSHNALKTGLTGRTILLPTDDVAVYQAQVERIFRQLAPESDEEKRLTQSLADTLWRLDRIPALEAGIYAIGRRELAAQFTDEEDEAVRKAMIEAQIFLSYRRDLNNLSVQEARLRRQYEKDEAELQRQIAEREKAAKDRWLAEDRRWDKAILHYRTARECGMPFDPAEIGFEFSTEAIAAREQQIEVKAAIQNGRYYEYKKSGYLKAA
jgi:hypothetical protein